MTGLQLDDIKEQLDKTATASQRIEMIQFLVGLTKRDFNNIKSSSNAYVKPMCTLKVGDVVECIHDIGRFCQGERLVVNSIEHTGKCVVFNTSETASSLYNEQVIHSDEPYYWKLILQTSQ